MTKSLPTTFVNSRATGKLVSVISLTAGILLLIRNPMSFVGLTFVILGILMIATKYSTAVHASIDASHSKIVTIPVLAMATLSIFVVAMLASLYWQDLYFPIMPLAFGVILVALLQCDQIRAERFFLPLLVLGAWLLRLEPILRYSTHIGVDTWFHSTFALDIAQSGYVPQGYLYSTFPSMHVLIASLIMITGGHGAWVTFAAASFMAALGPLAVYILARRFVGWKASILGSLLLAIMPDSINLPLNVLPTAFGYFVIPLLIWTATHKDRRMMATGFLLLLYLISSNGVLPLILLMIFTVMIVSEKFLVGGSRILGISRRSISVIAFVTLVYWMSVSYWMINVSVQVFESFVTQIHMFGNYVSFIAADYPSAILHNMPVSVFLALAGLGFYSAVSSRSKSSLRNYTIWSALCLAIGEGVIILNSPIIAYRWGVFAELVAAPVSGSVLWSLLARRGTRRTAFAGFCLILVFAFASITSTQAGGSDNGFVSNTGQNDYRDALKEAEFYSSIFALSHTGTFKSDFYVSWAFDTDHAYHLQYSSPFSSIPPVYVGPRILRITTEDVKLKFCDVNTPLLIRDYSWRIMWAYDVTAKGQEVMTFITPQAEASIALAHGFSRVFDDTSVLWIPISGTCSGP